MTKKQAVQYLASALVVSALLFPTTGWSIAGPFFGAMLGLLIYVRWSGGLKG